MKISIVVYILTQLWSYSLFACPDIDQNLGGDLCEMIRASTEYEKNDSLFISDSLFDQCPSQFSNFKLSMMSYSAEFYTIRRERCYQISADYQGFWRRAINLDGSTTSKALIVFIHGLNSHPAVWSRYLKQLGQSGQYDFWAPEVLDKGNTSLMNTIPPLVTALQNYMEEFPERPVALIGASNGARIALMLETLLRSTQQKIFVASIGGVHGGSSRIGFRYLWTDSELYQELSVGNQRAKNFIMQSQNKNLNESRRTFIFYGSRNDSQIIPTHSAFPVLNHNEQFFLASGVNHRGLVDRVRTHLLSQINHWIPEEGNS